MCIRDSPPAVGDRVKILNQMTETHRVKDLARIISGLTGAEISYLDNPRNEAAENELRVENKCFLEMGLKPTTLADGLMKEVTEIANKYADNCDRSKILCTSVWNQPKPRKIVVDEVKATTTKSSNNGQVLDYAEVAK